MLVLPVADCCCKVVTGILVVLPPLLWCWHACKCVDVMLNAMTVKTISYPMSLLQLLLYKFNNVFKMPIFCNLFADAEDMCICVCAMAPRWAVWVTYGLPSSSTTWRYRLESTDKYVHIDKNGAAAIITVLMCV